jgi:hypothetical protein
MLNYPQTEAVKSNPRANIAEGMAKMNWKLAQFMRDNDVTAYKLGNQLGGHTRISTVYRLIDEKQPSRIDFQTLADIIDGLRQITGKPVKLTDLLDYSDEPN